MLLVLGMILGAIIGVLGTVAAQSVFGSRRILITNSDLIPGAVKVTDPDSIQIKSINVPR